jgi:hypothetical protein
MNRRVGNKEFSWVIIWGVLTLIALILSTFYIKSLNSVQANHWFLVASLTLIPIGLFVISIFNWLKKSDNNHYFQFTIALFTTFIGFTIATAGQETLNNNDDREIMGSVIEMSINKYKGQIDRIDRVIHKEKYNFSMMAIMEVEMSVATMSAKNMQSEPLILMMDNQPFMLKDISNELKKYLSINGPVIIHYEQFDTRFQDVYVGGQQTQSNIYFLYMDYGNIYNELKIRKELFELELQLLKGELSKKEHQNKFNKIVQEDSKKLKNEIEKKAKYESSFYPDVIEN